MNLVSIGRTGALRKLAGLEPNGISRKILLVKPPYFSPWTPPLGIAILKSFLEPHGYSVRCYDFNSDPELWGMHHKYFNVLQTLEDVSINDGYSKLWWILNAHMLAYANGADPAACARVLTAVVPLQGMRISQAVIRQLLPLVENFYNRLNHLIEDFNLSEYGAVGTSTYTTSLGPSLFFLKRIKEQHPHIRTIMGGGAFADDLALGSDNLETLVREYDFIDHFVLGEGEMLLLKLLQGEFHGKRLISLADLHGKTLPMQDVPIPDFSDVGTQNYYHLTIEGARSCPFQCSFCSETIHWGDYRKRPMQLFADQVIDLATQYKNNSFFMGDSLMNPYINQFAGQLLERKANILYDGYLRADKPVTNRSFVKMWADSGCYRVRLGIESAAARVLDAMDKMTTPKVISDVLKTLANAGIRTTTYWITGFTGETEKDFQETCDFIREHHRYIYELEAHAYYYYPYGQIGSRLHECHSIYPDEVTDIIKFKVWEINDANPSRVERFDRLRRVSALASELGLPNIYTMAERFAAEERWHRLHPLALEVYEGTRLHRKLPRLPGKPIQVFDPQRWTKPNTSTDDVLCYQLTVTGSLDKEILTSAAAEVVRHNDVLQLSLKDGRYQALHSQPEQLTAFLDSNDNPRQSIELIASQMRPEPSYSFRIVAVPGEEHTELFLLAHRAVADGRAVTLLCEDLFRIYQQLANKKELSLHPVDKTYTELMEELIRETGESVADATVSEMSVHQELESQTVSLDKELLFRLLSGTLKKCDLTPGEVITMALLRSLSGVFGEEQRVDVTADYRSLDTALDRAVGVLTRSYELPATVCEGDDLFASVALLRKSLQKLQAENIVAPPAVSNRILLNLEFVLQEPWLGGDLWTARGFVDPPGKANSDYLLEVIPALSHDGITVNFNYQSTANISREVEKIKHQLAAELDSVLKDCERYAAAKDFWSSEFEKTVPAANLDFAYDVTNDSLADEWVAVPAWIESSVLDDLSRKCDLDINAAILSALSIILSRLSGREDVVVLTSIQGNAMPIKLNASWDTTFRSFSRQVSDKLAQAQKHGTYALRILNEKGVFDVACVEIHSPQTFQHVIDSLEVTQTLRLILEIVLTGSRSSFQLLYKQHDLAETLVKRIALYLKTILAGASTDANVRLGDIALEEEAENTLAPEILAQDVFTFGGASNL